MARFQDRDCKVYVVAPTRKEATAFIARKGLTSAHPVTRVEDLPRERGLNVILLRGYDRRMEDYECFFGVGGLFYDFGAAIFYEHEVQTRN